MPKILSAHDAVRQYIHDGDTVTFGGFASGLMHPSWAGCARKTSWPATTCPRG